MGRRSQTTKGDNNIESTGQMRVRLSHIYLDEQKNTNYDEE